MRYRFARENIDTIIGYHYNEGALKFEEGKTYPVYWENDFSATGNLIGQASVIKREDDGWLLAEIAWVNEKGEQAAQLVADGQGFVTIYGNEVVKQGSYPASQGNTAQFEVQSVTLKALYVCYDATDPWTEGPYRPTQEDNENG